ncbi:MAG: ABC transporter ATP-binding protein [Ectothiorhodospiraceae bacterium]|nr:ABC transporter ATP-binding protein [Ectothiorhodospiraceae bacterium]
MISLNKISKHYGGEYLFKDLSLRIGDRERIAIVGSNGAGKSTLMKVMVGEIEHDEGELAASSANTVGYLPQDGVHHTGRTLLDEARHAFDDILELHDRVERLTAEIARLSANGGADSPAVHRKVEELGEVQHQLEHREGYNIETRVAMVLSGLGFKEEEFTRMTDTFSGGWQMRIALAKLLLQEPTILLLDEPTNHLDLESLEWLEDYLQTYEGSIVLVSHDRVFLDNLVERTIEISMGKATEYAGNYTEYLIQKEERMEQLQAAFERQQQFIKQTTRFVERFRYKATKARQVQSRVKALEKMDRIEMEDEEGSISFDFPDPPSAGKIVMTVERIRKAYGDNEVFRDVSMQVERGDRIAFLGVNGSGKSTLARILAGIEPYQDGERRPGHNVIVGYYAQHQADEMPGHKTVLQTLDDIATGDVRKHIRTLLGCFLFSGDDVFKKVAVLSGGEKSRLALAKMLLTPANFLILDEPTNHLDIRSKAVLQDALLRFNGSYLIVSHDRDFLEPLLNKVYDFHEGEFRLTLGTVSDYMRKRQEEKDAEAVRTGKRGTDGAALEKRSTTHKDKDRKREEAERRQQRYKLLKPLKNKAQRMEAAIEKLEQRKTEVEAALGDSETYKNEQLAKELNAEYAELAEKLKSSYTDWEYTLAEMERLEEEG